MRRFLAIAPLLALLVGCNRLTSTSGAKTTLTTDNEKIIYAIGLNMARPLGQLNLTPAEMAILNRGIADQVAGKAEIKLEEWGPKINEFAAGRMGQASVAEKAKGAEFLEKAAKESGAVKTASGLVYRELKAGTGKSPKASDGITAHYRGTLIDGKEFDSSVGKDPLKIPLGGVIPCWTEGIQMMKVGGKAQLVCPSQMAYGENPPPGIPAGATLVFEVELLGID